MDKTIKQLIIENEELNSRLVESEETLQAIRDGEMDAIVVSGMKGEQIYTISSAETPYRIFMEEMNEGALTISKDGIILYCNHKFAELVHEPVERIIGSYFKQFVAPADRPKFDKLFTHQAKYKKAVLIVSLINSLFLKLSFHLLPAYLQGDNYILIATDVTELKKKEYELLKLYNLLEQKLDIIQRLRMQLIDKKIDLKLEIDQLKKSNKKLLKEITINKLAEAKSKRKQKNKKAGN